LDRSAGNDKHQHHCERFDHRRLTGALVRRLGTLLVPFPASAAGAQAWRAPIFPNATPLAPIGKARVPAWASASPYLPGTPPNSTAVTSSVPNWSPSHSLLGALAQLPSPATPSGGNSNGLPSSPAWDGSLLAPLAQLSPPAISPNDKSSGPTSSAASGISPSLPRLAALAQYSPPVLPNANSIGPAALIPAAANASDYDDLALLEALKLNVVDFGGSTSPTAGDPNPYARSDSDSSAGANYGPVSPGLGTPSPPGLDAGLLSRFFSAINPIGSAQAAEDEGPPPEVLRALAEALADAAAAKDLAKTRDVLGQYHAALKDLFDAAQGRSSSKVLGKALELSGVERPAGYEAHHIVPGNLKPADRARQVLQKFAIDVNDAANGVFLPGDKTTVNIGREALHRPLHTNAYMKAVNEALEKAKTRQDAIDTLQAISRALRSGGYP
jgi:hypothetical protein